MRFAAALPLVKRQLRPSSLEAFYIYIFLLAPDLRFVLFAENLNTSPQNFLTSFFF